MANRVKGHPMCLDCAAVGRCGTCDFIIVENYRAKKRQQQRNIRSGWTPEQKARHNEATRARAASKRNPF